MIVFFKAEKPENYENEEHFLFQNYSFVGTQIVRHCGLITIRASFLQQNNC